MQKEYNCSSSNVNNQSSLISDNLGYRLISMKYGERLKKARIHKGLTQTELAERIGRVCSQENISKLERGDATGSEYTVQFAEACGVNPYWLATGDGEMVTEYRPQNSRIEHALKIMEKLPPEALDYVIRDLDQMDELVHKLLHKQGAN
jgi:transcriptional regulator with XRE-family HTH domain